MMRRPAPLTIRLMGATLIAALSFTLTGCWDRRETDALAIAGSIGVDRISPGKVLVSAEVVHNEALSGGTGQLAAPGNIVGWVMIEEASTVPNALLNIQRRMPKRFFLGQVSTLVIGMNFAREGVIDALDFFGANPQLRRSLYVTTCDTASGLLMRPFVRELASQTLTGLIENSLATGMAPLVTLNEILLKLSEPGIEPITLHSAGRATHDSLIKRAGEEVTQTYTGDPIPEPIDSETPVPWEHPPGSVVLDPLREQGTGERVRAITFSAGLAAYRGDKMVGSLDGKDARGYLWAVGRVRGGVLEVTNPFYDGGASLALGVVRAPASLEVRVRDGRPSVTIKLNVDLQISSLPMSTPLHEPGSVAVLEAVAKATIETEITRALALVREQFSTDIYGFGQAIYRKNPKLWHSLADDWNDRGLQELEIGLDVRVRLRSPGGIFLRHRLG